MEKQDLNDLLERYYQGACTPKEEQALKFWLHQYNMEGPTGLTDEQYAESNERMLEAINSATLPVVKTRPLLPRIGIAAAVATVILSAGIWFYQASQKQHSTETFVNDIAPGKQGATLTLANGTKIRLSDATNGELAQEAGVVITKTADGQLVYEVKNATDENKVNTIATANGETYQVRLPDGSAVWLNAGSSLTYPISLLQGGKRRVSLIGEGYFRVAKDRDHPFIVKSRGQEVEVLGTHFNVSAYPDEAATVTTLEEGSVRVLADGGAAAKLAPGEQSLFAGRDFKVSAADLQENLAWKDGDFVFNDQTIEEVLRKVSRWYDVEVVYVDGVPGGTFYAKVSRDKNISQVLRALELTKLVHFKVEGRRILVSK